MRAGRNNICRVFKDSAISGSCGDREGIKDMPAFLHANNKKRFVVIIDDISRPARDIRVHLDLRDAINECSAVLESPSVTFGTDSDGRYFENVQALNAQRQREKNAEQTKKRQQARLIDGYWPFPASPGYRHERKPGHGKVMVPQEPLASIMREALEGYASGRFATQAEVARFLETQPDFPKTRYGTVTIEAAHRIMTRVIYAGYVEAPKWNIPLLKGKHDGLISLETYEKIQERLYGKPKIAVRADIDEDFPLRGFVLCGDCGNPLTACRSKSKTGAKHPYYMCHKKGCESKGKSVRRAHMESAFEDLLQTAQPSKTLLDLARAMFKKAWNAQSETEAAHKASLKRELLEAEKKPEGLLDRIVTTDSHSVIAAYEKRIEKPENRRLSTRSFDEAFELAIKFLANPYKIWALGRLEHKRSVLKLAFKDPLRYCRKNGFRTPTLSSVFKGLDGFLGQKNVMAEGMRFELTIRLPVYTLSRRAPSTARPPLRKSGLGNAGGLCIRRLAGGRQAFFTVNPLFRFEAPTPFRFRRKRAAKHRLKLKIGADNET
jgi:site-specific DNA recombinase